MEIGDKVAIVTGASEGIGLATARYLAAQGAKVVLAARSAGKLHDLERELPGALAIPTDMRRPHDIQDLMDMTMERYGRIDILINNAGQGVYGTVETTEVEALEEIMELNVYAVLRAMQAVIPIMRKQGGGTIVNISSMVSKMYIPGLAFYASTKYALNAISLTARAELAADNIVVSVIYPKMTATNFGVHAIGARQDERTTGQRTPNIDMPEDVAAKIGELIRSGEAEAMM